MSAPRQLRFQRARPLLGTLVEIRIEGLDEADANRAMDTGFGVIADIHRLMSFHEPASDVSRLNRDAARGAVAVDPRTAKVIRRAQDFAAVSDGAFDITVAPRLVDWGFLPTPAAPAADARATWQDIVTDGDAIHFRKPLWIDLGGIAKGYAVDAAIQAMALPAHVQVCVNAGGDLRVAGPVAEPVQLRVPVQLSDIPVIALENGSLASSSGWEHRKSRGNGQVGPHVNGRDGQAAPVTTFVSVAAPECLVADALTKVVLACGRTAETILRGAGATAYVHERDGGWKVFGGDT